MVSTQQFLEFVIILMVNLDILNKTMMNKELDIAYFLSFCMEQYKNRHQMSGEEVATLFEQYDVLPYLKDNFEVLHTQGHQWLMEEIDEWINKQKSETKI